MTGILVFCCREGVNVRIFYVEQASSLFFFSLLPVNGESQRKESEKRGRGSRCSSGKREVEREREGERTTARRQHRVRVL